MAKPILPAFLSCQGPHLSDAEKRLFASANPLGFCLFSLGCENIKSREQVRKLIKEIKETVGRDNVLIAVDQEGGRVRRLVEPEFTPLASAADLQTEEMARRHACLASYDMKSCGINVNFAPVLDVEYPFTSNVLKGRCFSSDKEQIAKLGRAMVDEYIKNGVCPCVKHLPGHGRGAADPHLQLPVITDNLPDLENDFYPFIKLNDAPMGMLAHILLKEIDAGCPATLSSKVISEIIREKIGFKGLLVSDAIQMNALKGSIAERAEAVYNAGCEVICLGNASLAENEELCASGLTLSDEAEEKLQKIVDIVRTSGDFGNYEYIKNKYCTSLKSIITYDCNYDATEVLNRLRKQ